ncbi:MAG: DUF2716 domain-containing protein [Treponema sp.]|nr:DUF2716 domain-containing protein [Treponema sp.]
MEKEMRIIENKESQVLWDTIENEYCFRPCCTKDRYNWIVLPMPHKKYSLKEVWSETTEKLINSFFEELAENNLFALNWQHDGFVFSPIEYNTINFEYYDKTRECNVYFPTYYPNGDYLFFFDKNYKIGLFGHPWLREVLVLGKKLIQKFDSNTKELGILEIKE